VPISSTSETLRVARQRVAMRERMTPRGDGARAAATAEPAVATIRRSGANRSTAHGRSPVATAFAVTISWVAAGALVIGFVWVASTMSPNPPTRTPADTLPYALGWSGASLAMLATSVGSLFARGGRRLALLIVTAALALILLAFTVTGHALLS
jgi:hypothetical protein